VDAAQAGLAHQARHPAAAAALPARAQFGVDARAAVGSAAAPVDLANALGQLPIGPRSRRGPPVPPGVVARARHAQRPAQQPDRVVGGLVGDELAAVHRVALALAKYTAAFLRISRSSFSSATSRRSLASSAFSSVVTPARWPASTSAWRSQRRMVSGSTPRSRATWLGRRPLVRASSTARARNSAG
jgi:hypothetical protein